MKRTPKATEGRTRRLAAVALDPSDVEAYCDRGVFFLHRQDVAGAARTLGLACVVSACAFDIWEPRKGGLAEPQGRERLP